MKGIKAGTAKITATVLKKKYTCTVTVKKAADSAGAGTSDPDSTSPGSQNTQDSGFVYSRDCKVVSGTENIYIEFEINKETTTEAEMEAAGYTVKDGKASETVVCETATYIFTKLPQTQAEIESIPLTTKFAPVAAAICACAAFDTSKSGITNQYTHPIFDMMDYLNGPKLTISNVAKSGLFYSMCTTLGYGKLAYFNGATPQNAYTPTTPYTVKLVHGPYYIPARSATVAHPEGESERHIILISFAGDQAQRYVDVYHSGDGNWYTWDNSWQHLVAGMLDVATDSGW